MRGVGKQGVHTVFYNVPIVKDMDPMIKDMCAWCGRPCDSEFVEETRTKRYNERGNCCYSCSHPKIIQRKVPLAWDESLTKWSENHFNLKPV